MVACPTHSEPRGSGYAASIPPTCLSSPAYGNGLGPRAHAVGMPTTSLLTQAPRCHFRIDIRTESNTYVDK